MLYKNLLYNYLTIFILLITGLSLIVDIDMENYLKIMYNDSKKSHYMRHKYIIFNKKNFLEFKKQDLKEYLKLFTKIKKVVHKFDFKFVYQNQMLIKSENLFYR